MRAYVAVGTLVFIIGCGGHIDNEPVSARTDDIGDPTPDASTPESSPAPPDGGGDIAACWVDAPFFDAGAPGESVFVNALMGDPAACGLPSICTMDPAPQALCDRLCGPGTQDCYYTTQPLDVNCAVSKHRLFNEWDAGYPCVE